MRPYSVGREQKNISLMIVIGSKRRGKDEVRSMGNVMSFKGSFVLGLKKIKKEIVFFCF